MAYSRGREEGGREGWENVRMGCLVVWFGGEMARVGGCVCEMLVVIVHGVWGD